MLLFIDYAQQQALGEAGFNTSHVVIYPVKGDVTKAYPSGFNTSHVVIYQLKKSATEIVNTCFNTSHVVIYRRLLYDGNYASGTFQYISCCYLSFPFSSCFSH